MTRLEIIDLKFPLNSGAPSPKLICDDVNLILLFYVDIFELPEISDNILERDISQDKGVAILRFKNVYIHKFGIPNDEVLFGHPYYDLGLKPYSMSSIIDSDWIKDIKRIQVKHPYFNEQSFDKLAHYIITFKDNTFECIAENYNVEYSYDTMKESFLKTIHDINN